MRRQRELELDLAHLGRAETPQRREAYEGVWQQVSKDLPIIYLWTPRNIVGLSSKVAGFTFLADGLLRLQDVHPAR